MMFLRITLIFACVLLLTAPLRAQTAVSEPDPAAVMGAEKWLQQIDAGEHAESWQGAAEYFRNAVTQEQWQGILKAVRNPLGKLISRKVKSQTFKKMLPGAPDGEYVVIEFETSFENKKTAVETVTPMKEKDGKWRVSGYFIK